MLDAAFIRDHLDEVRTRLRTRGVDLEVPLAELMTLEATRRRLIPALEELKRQQNVAASEIGQAKREQRDPGALFEANRERAQQIKQLDIQLQAVEEQRHALLLTLPNLPHATVPMGRNEADNQEVRRHGEPPRFDFPPKAHWDLGPALGILDFERAAKIAGARFVVLTGAGARLSRALINFMLELHTREHGYVEVEPPFLANGATLTSTGHLPKFEADLFRVAGEWDLFLIPTGEVPLTSLHRDEILDARRLPIKYVTYTPCFRSEAGSYGKDVRGMIRQHQFDKVELVKLTTAGQSYDELEALTRDAERVLERLELPYRTVVLCTADVGFSAAKSYDVEVWLPAQNAYKEISSCSNTEAFQARRANIKARAGGGKPEFVHTLNGSGLAVGRTLVAILENYQQRDGSVVVPRALRPFMNGQEVVEP